MLLADDMGLGKTVQGLAAIRILTIRRVITRTLLVVPASLVNQWRREISRWAPELRVMVIRGTATDRAWQWRADVHIAIVGYETFRNDYTANPLSGPRRVVWDLVVIDEAQKIKNRDIEISREVKGLRRRRSWALTGTPLENRLDDLASIMEFVDQGAETTDQRWFPGPALLQRHREVQLRRRKADVLRELPPKTVIDIDLTLPRRQRDAYDRAERQGVVQLRALGEQVRIQHVLELITRLKQLCNVDPVSRESAKVSDLRERLETLTAEGHRALIFSQYVSQPFGVDALAEALAAFRPLTFTGALSSAERDRVIAQFKAGSRHKALVMSLRAGGLGLNLQEASYVFHVDRWWNPAVERQAEDRSHRMGQTVPVTVFKYTCEDTIEERIRAILAAKQQLFNTVIDDVSIDVTTHLSASELFGLFGLDAPRRPR